MIGSISSTVTAGQDKKYTTMWKKFLENLSKLIKISLSVLLAWWILPAENLINVAR